VARIVERAEGEGLDGARYRLEPVSPRAVTAAFNGAPASEADAVQDVQLTYVFLRYAADLSGRFDPKAAGPFWLTRPPPRDLVPWLEQSLQSGRIVAAFAALSPAHAPDRAEPGALALASCRPRSPLRDGERSVLSARRPRGRPARRGDEGRDRKTGQPHARLRRRDDDGGLQPVLERAADDRRGRDLPRGPEGLQLPPAQRPGARARHAGRGPRRAARRSRPDPPAPGNAQFARPRQAGLPQPV